MDNHVNEAKRIIFYHVSLRFYSLIHCIAELLFHVVKLVERFISYYLFFSPLWEMVQEGIDLKSIEWTQH